jgi:hypothetical protein
MNSGAPITPSYSLVNFVDFSGSTSAGVRPIVSDPGAGVASCAIAGAPCRFGPPGYASVTTPTLGNVGKGVLRGPGTNNWDISAYRNIRFSERRGINGQLRFETYNTFNHTQFGGYDTGLKFDAQHNQINPLFMQPNSARPARRAQVSARITF